MKLKATEHLKPKKARPKKKKVHHSDDQFEGSIFFPDSPEKTTSPFLTQAEEQSFPHYTFWKETPEKGGATQLTSTLVEEEEPSIDSVEEQ